MEMFLNFLLIIASLLLNPVSLVIIVIAIISINDTKRSRVMDKNIINFEAWADEVKRINDLLGIANTDKKAFRGYYDEGCTPCQAVEEDLQNAW